MAGGALGFGIARSIDPTKSRSRLAQLCELMTRELGGVFLPHHAASYRQLARDFETGTVVIAWMPPLLCIELEKSQPAAAIILPVRGGAMTYYSALVARRTGGPRTLSEVQKARVAWVDPESSSGYLVPRLHLQAQGRSLDAMFGSEIMMGSHVAVLDAVESGRADVGATFCATKAPRWTNAQGVERPIDALTIAGPIPNDAIVLSARVPEDVRARVARWLVAERSERVCELTAELLGATQFRAASLGHFAPLRRMVGAASYAP